MSTKKIIFIASLVCIIVPLSMQSRQRSLPKYPNEKEIKLFDAIKHGDIEAVKKLVAAKVNVNFFNPAYNLTALMTAALFGHENVVRLLLTHKADSTIVFTGQTYKEFALFGAASRKEYAKAREYLKDASIQVFNAITCRDKKQRVCMLELACLENDTSHAQELLGLGLCPNTFREYHPLLTVIHNNNVQLAQSLIVHKAYINVLDANLRTPLMIAASHNRPALVRLLFDHKADITLTNKDGKTAFEHALGKKDILQAFKDYGHHPRNQLLARQIQDAMQTIAEIPALSALIASYHHDIFDAIEQGDVDGVRVELMENSDLTQKNEEGFTPGQWLEAHKKHLEPITFTAIKAALEQVPVAARKERRSLFACIFRSCA